MTSALKRGQALRLLGLDADSLERDRPFPARPPGLLPAHPRHSAHHQPGLGTESVGDECAALDHEGRTTSIRVIEQELEDKQRALL